MRAEEPWSRRDANGRRSSPRVRSTPRRSTTSTLQKPTARQGVFGFWRRHAYVHRSKNQHTKRKPRQEDQERRAPHVDLLALLDEGLHHPVGGPGLEGGHEGGKGVLRLMDFIRMLLF